MKRNILATLAMVIMLFATQVSYAKGLEGLEVAFSMGGLFGDTWRDTVIGGTKFEEEVDDGGLFLGRFSYPLFKDMLGLEANLGVGTNDAVLTGQDVDGQALMFDVGPYIQVNVKPVSYFFNLTFGFIDYDVDSRGDNAEFSLAFGGGIKYYFTGKFGLRFDLRDHVVFLRDEGFWRDGAEDNIHLWELSGGIFYRF